MGALGSNTIVRDLVVIGYSAPREYEAGSFVDDSGREVKYDAGASMRVYCFDRSQSGMDVAVMKVKSKNVPAVFASLEGVDRGTELTLEYLERRGQYELVGVN